MRLSFEYTFPGFVLRGFSRVIGDPLFLLPQDSVAPWALLCERSAFV